MAELAAAYRARNICQTWLARTGELLDSLTVTDSSARVNDILSAKDQVQYMLDQWYLQAVSIDRLFEDHEVDQVVTDS